MRCYICNEIIPQDLVSLGVDVCSGCVDPDEDNILFSEDEIEMLTGETFDD